MKKSLLIVCGLGVGLVATAQNKTSQKYIVSKPKDKFTEQAVSGNAPAAPAATRSTPLVITNAALTVVPTGGQSNNTFGTYSNISRSLMDYNPGLNTLTFVHRSCNSAAAGCTPPDGTSNSGNFNYDLSKDGGNTWSGQRGPVYKTFGGQNPGRYPQCFIVNPSGNTNPDNAYMSYAGVALDAAGAAWVGYASGTSKISTPDTACSAVSLSQGHVYAPESGIITANNTMWQSGLAFDAGDVDYNDTIIIRKGTYNTSTNCVDWTTTKLPFPVTVDGAGGFKHYGYNSSIAFSSNGQIGYLAALGNADVTFAPDTGYYVTLWKTTDGGATWGSAVKLSVDVNTQMGTTGLGYSTGFQIDGAVDKNNKLHLIMGVGPTAGAGSLSTVPGSWGEFAMMTDGTTGGTTLTLLAKPQTFRGIFHGTTPPTNDLQEDSRGQIAVSPNGDAVFYVWFDTDTTDFTPNPANNGRNNTNPNAVVRMYDVNMNGWGSVTNLTKGSSADGQCTFAFVSYYTGTGCGAASYQLHIGFSGLNGGITDKAVIYNYLNGVCITSTGELANNSFNIGDAYPNPTNGSATLEVEVKKADFITVEVTNMIGQTIYSTSANLTAGTHQFNLEGSKWNSGVYFYTVKTKDFSVTKKLVRE